MSDLPSSFLDYVNRRGYNTFDKVEETVRHRQPWSYQSYLDSIKSELGGEEIELYSATPSITGETLATASGGTAAAAATAGASSITPGIALGAGLVGSAIVGGAISGLTSSNNDNIHKDPIISIPGHHYSGPGNTLTDTKPIDKDDHLAQQHDKDYQSAKTDEDIREADREFIASNLDLARKGDTHAIVNTLGIGGKYALESLTGVLYKGTLHFVIFLLVPWVLN